MKKLAAILIAVCCLLSGCGWQSNADVPAESDEKETEEVKRISMEYTSDYGVYEFSVPEFEKATGVEYLSQTELESLRDPLVALLSTFRTEDVDFGGGELEKSAEHLYGSDGVGLMDINGDGIPEAAEWYRNGGTLLNSTIRFYDLFSGEEVGMLVTGWYGDVITYEDENGHYVNGLDEGGSEYGYWRVYVDENDAPFVFGMYNYGNMIGRTERYFSRVVFNEELQYSYNKNAYYWFRDYENIHENDENVRIHLFVDNGFYFFRDYKTQVLVDEVEQYFADLTGRYREVEGSMLTVINWSEIEGYEDMTQKELAAEMTERLLASGQRFLKGRN